VRDHGGAGGYRRRSPGGGAHRRQTVQDAAREVRRGGRDLAGPKPPGALARHEIGKGSADVDADATSHIAPLTAHHPSTVTRVPASAPFGPLDRAMPHAVSWSGPGRRLCAPIASSGRSTSTQRGSVIGSWRAASSGWPEAISVVSAAGTRGISTRADPSPTS